MAQALSCGGIERARLPFRPLRRTSVLKALKEETAEI